MQRASAGSTSRFMSRRRTLLGGRARLAVGGRPKAATLGAGTGLQGEMILADRKEIKTLPVLGDDEPQLDNTRGWQRAASQAVDSFCQRALLQELVQPCLTPRLGRTLPVYSLRGQLRLNSLWNPRCPVCCFCDGAVCRSRSQQLGAGATSRVMFSEITLQPAPGLVSCAHVEARLNERLPELVGRLAPVMQHGPPLKNLGMRGGLPPLPPISGLPRRLFCYSRGGQKNKRGIIG